MNEKTFLDKIVLSTQKRVQSLKESLALKPRSEPLPSLAKALKTQKNLNIIAEIKFASPSAGVIRSDLSPIEVARQYIENGAKALSVLTEPEYFKGNPDYIRLIREEFPDIPILMKDFIIDEFQIRLASSLGASAVLLIVGILKDEELRILLNIAREFGLEVLMEVHCREEMLRALDCPGEIIGINNRNLAHLKIELETSRKLISEFSSRFDLFVCESGLNNHAQLLEFADLGFSGFLVGSHLMKQASPGHALSYMLTGLRD